MMNRVGYIRCLMDQHVRFDGVLSNWAEKERGVLGQVALSVKFNSASQKGWVTSKATLNGFFPAQIKDKLSSSLNLATECFSLFWLETKKVYSSFIPPAAI